MQVVVEHAKEVSDAAVKAAKASGQQGFFFSCFCTAMGVGLGLLRAEQGRRERTNILVGRSLIGMKVEALDGA